MKNSEAFVRLIEKDQLEEFLLRELKEMGI